MTSRSVSRLALISLVALFAGLTAACEPAPGTPGEALAWDGPVLQEGNQGPDVAAMQRQLLKRGFWLPSANGTFDSHTRHALTAFQKYMRASRSGKLDANTRYILAAVNDKVTPRWGGTKSVEIDITRQIAMMQTNGEITWIFDISSGKSSTPTPIGNYRIYNRVSKLGTLWRPRYFTGGYALHGSPSVPTYPASHGCIRFTNAEMNAVWDMNLAPIGTPVRVFR